MRYSRRKLYFILSTACIAGYAWLSYNMMLFTTKEIPSYEICIIKRVTSIPCPSCGSTRSVYALLSGQVLESLLINPFGVLISIIMLFLPLWILFDVLTKKKTLWEFYFRAEQFIRKPKVAIPLVLIVIINWIWNIIKHL